MGKRKGYDQFAEFRKLSKDEQRESILNLAVMCIDGAPTTLARKIEIYFDESDEDRQARKTAIYDKILTN